MDNAGSQIHSSSHESYVRVQFARASLSLDLYKKALQRHSLYRVGPEFLNYFLSCAIKNAINPHLSVLTASSALV